MSDLSLRLQLGLDIPDKELGLTFHQPTLKEIAFIGEEKFYMACELLHFRKNKMSLEEQHRLSKYSDFQILMAILLEDGMEEDLNYVKILLQMIFPTYSIEIKNNGILLIDKENNTFSTIDSQNFIHFSEIISKMFSMDKSQEDDYVAGNAKAQELIDKFREGRRKIAKEKGQKDVDIIGRYISILSVGLQKDANTFLNYTLYQILDEFERYILKQSYDTYLSAKMAGASGMDEPENWTDSLINRKINNNKNE